MIHGATSTKVARHGQCEALRAIGLVKPGLAETRSDNENRFPMIRGGIVAVKAYRRRVVADASPSVTSRFVEAGIEVEHV